MSADTESIRRLEFGLQLQLNWIKASETRISLTLPLSTGMLGALAFITSSDGLNNNLMVSGIAAATFLTVSILSGVSAYFPRTESSNPSLIFFGTIAAVSAPDFKQRIQSRNDDDYEDDLVSQVHRNACIALIKYKRFQYSITLLTLAVVPWFVAILSHSGLLNATVE